MGRTPFHDKGEKCFQDLQGRMTKEISEMEDKLFAVATPLDSSNSCFGRNTSIDYVYRIDHWSPLFYSH